jgi:hypothetical protein
MVAWYVVDFVGDTELDLPCGDLASTFASLLSKHLDSVSWRCSGQALRCVYSKRCRDGQGTLLPVCGRHRSQSARLRSCSDHRISARQPSRYRTYEIPRPALMVFRSWDCRNDYAICSQALYPKPDLICLTTILLPIPHVHPEIDPENAVISYLKGAQTKL